MVIGIWEWKRRLKGREERSFEDREGRGRRGREGGRRYMGRVGREEGILEEVVVKGYIGGGLFGDFFKSFFRKV